jgi:Tfp pilus assembly protein FimT
MAMNGTPANRRIGVTLIETLMVISLLAAAAVASSILLDGEWVARRGVTAVTNDVANSLITARNTAITNQATVRVQRSRRSGVEQLLITEDAGPFRSNKSWIVELGDNARIRGVPREIQFTPTGTANRSLTWSIRQSRSSGEVSVAPASGQVIRRLP